MSFFDLQKSLERARKRFGDAPLRSTRVRRADRGVPRLDPAVIGCVAEALSDQERPRMRDMLSRLQECCRSLRLQPPSRATVYKMMSTISSQTLRWRDLPPSVQSALHNLTQESEVPGHQVAFYCFNYGDLRAVSFAAGLPWLSLYQASRLPGYRKKSRGLLEAVTLVRRI